MVNGAIITVVIPAYKVEKHIINVITTIPDFVDNIIVVDDACPNGSGNVAKTVSNKKLLVMFNKENLGVGGAVIQGYKKSIELGSDIIIKMDGDGQMNPSYIKELIYPILNNKADYTKGNRFVDFKALKSMPKIRLFGNSILSFLIKVASGYYNIMDPTNGYTAISKNLVKSINFDNIANRYFFESDMLINLNIHNAVVKDIPIPAQYGDEKSSLSIKKVLLTFPPKILGGFAKRIFYKNFLYNFDMLALYLIAGVPLLLFGTVYGVINWIYYGVNDIPAPTGTVMLSVLPIIIGLQFILQAISLDMNGLPKK